MTHAEIANCILWITRRHCSRLGTRRASQWRGKRILQTSAHVPQVPSFGLRVYWMELSWMDGKVGRNRLKWEVRVFRAHFLNNGQVPLSIGVMARCFRLRKTCCFFSTTHLHLRMARSHNPPLIAPLHWHAHPAWCQDHMGKRAYPLKICNTPKTPKPWWVVKQNWQFHPLLRLRMARSPNPGVGPTIIGTPLLECTS